MSYGMKVSKPGENVFTTGIENLYVDTTYPLLKIKSSGTGTLSVSDGGSDSDTITHNLGYIPNVMVFGQTYNISSSSKIANYTRYPYKSYLSTYYSDFTYTVSSTQLVISGTFWDESSNSETFGYYYYIFYDQ
jgi:hypothetical protein